jgi:hypothetical protein
MMKQLLRAFHRIAGAVGSARTLKIATLALLATACCNAAESAPVKRKPIAKPVPYSLLNPPPGITPAQTRSWFPWSPRGIRLPRPKWTKETRPTYEARVKWFHEAKWGLLCHFLAYSEPMLTAEKGPLSARPAQTWTSKEWNAWVDAVDVEKFADQAQELGVGYVILTLGQWHQFTCGPNPVADKLWGFKPGQYNATRDLPMDLGKALAKRNIPLMLYIMAEDPNRYPRPTGWTAQDVNTAWIKATQWYSDHYGTLCKGWWVDGLGTVDPKAKVEAAAGYCSEFVKALKHGNADALVGCGVYEISDFIHGHCGPHWDRQSRDGKPFFGRWDRDFNIQWQVLQYVGRHWGATGVAHSTDEIVAYAADVVKGGGIITFDVGMLKTVAGKTVGPCLDLPPDQFEQLKAVRDALKNIPASDGSGK